MLENIQHEINLFIYHSLYYLKPWVEIIGLVWCINIVNWIVGSPLNRFALYPRRFSGLLGIFVAPILHHDFKHLLFNTVPLLVLGLVLLLMKGTLNFCWISLFIVTVSGIAVWLIARTGIHLGASGLISGYFGYILISAYTAPSFTTIISAILAVYYFGGILTGLAPGKKETSWESHLFGFLSGILCAYVPNALTLFIHS